jgi:hypothetical protein
LDGREPEIYITDSAVLDELNKEAMAMQREIPNGFVDLMVELLVLPNRPTTAARNALQQSQAISINQRYLCNIRQNYFTIDLQPTHEYNTNHTPQSFNLDLNLTTEEIWTILNGFNTYYLKKTGRSCCFLFRGSNTPTEISRVSSLCLDLARRQMAKVCMVVGDPESAPHDEESC